MKDQFVPLIKGYSAKSQRSFGLSRLLSTVEQVPSALKEHGSLEKNMGNDLHLGIVCGLDLSSNWPSYVLMSVV